MWDRASDAEGWFSYDLADAEHFGAVLAPLRARREAGGFWRVRMEPRAAHCNLLGKVHGGAILTLIDMALFAAGHLDWREEVVNGVTLDCQCQFLGAASSGTPLDAVTEITRETGRMIFVRGLVEQDGATCASYSGILRKATTAR